MEGMNALLSLMKSEIKKEEAKKLNPVVIAFAVIGLVLVAAGAAYLIYRFMQPDYYDDYDDDVYEDEYEDDNEDDVDTESDAD